jgi:hypothetical protein
VDDDSIWLINSRRRHGPKLDFSPRACHQHLLLISAVEVLWAPRLIFSQQSFFPYTIRVTRHYHAPRTEPPVADCSSAGLEVNITGGCISRFFALPTRTMHGIVRQIPT